MNSVQARDAARELLEIMPLVLLQNIQEGGATPDPKDPMADFVLGTNRLTPSFDNVFPKSGSMSVIGAVYNATKDATTGKASVNWGFSILKEGKPVAKTEDQVVETDVASPSIGPVPLGNFAPGKYVVQLRVRDNVAKKDYTKDAPFEVK